MEKDICEVIDAPLERGRPDDPGDLTSATHTSGQRITKGRRLFIDICTINGEGLTEDSWDIEDSATYTIGQRITTWHNKSILLLQLLALQVLK